jgi:hypothetical protein
VKQTLHSRDAPRRWLVMVHQLPSEPSHFRVRAWRQMRDLGAISVKQAVNVLPDSTVARADFQRLSLEIRDAGGDASVFSAEAVDPWSDEALVETFRQSRQRAYRALEREIRKAVRLTRRRSGRGVRAQPPQKVLGRFHQRLIATERLDFFAAPGRDRVVALLQQMARAAAPADRGADGPHVSNHPAKAYRGRVWVTRPRPGVDRMASAWLIRRFIDPDAHFAFATDRGAVLAGTIPFDMSEVEFSHHEGGCTFETLCERFGIRGRAVGHIAAIVHDLDLKDDRFGVPDTATIGAVVQGLQLAHAADEVLLEQGMALFEALYRSSAHATDPAGSRPTRRKTS